MSENVKVETTNSKGRGRRGWKKIEMGTRIEEEGEENGGERNRKCGKEEDEDRRKIGKAGRQSVSPLRVIYLLCVFCAHLGCGRGLVGEKGRIEQSTPRSPGLVDSAHSAGSRTAYRRPF